MTYERWAVVVAIAVGAGCMAATESACRDQDCSGHGSCVTTSHGAHCECEENFVAVGLSCVADCSDVGCSGRGGCVVVENEPWCVCDLGYYSVGWECLPQPDGYCGDDECSGQGLCVEEPGKPAFCICRYQWVPFGLAWPVSQPAAVASAALAMEPASNETVHRRVSAISDTKQLDSVVFPAIVR
jgi:hypothetical protein